MRAAGGSLVNSRWMGSGYGRWHGRWIGGSVELSVTVSSSMLSGERGGHAGRELAIYIKLKWFKTNRCHYTQ